MRLRSVVPLSIVSGIILAACSGYCVPPRPMGGAGGAGGAGAAGDAVACDTIGDCPEVAADCLEPLCVDGNCSTANAAVGKLCDEAGGNVCDGGGLCVKDDGMPCAVDIECLSGMCIDDVCCASACSGVCSACNIAGSEGVCTPHAAQSVVSECMGKCDGCGQCASGELDWAIDFESLGSMNSPATFSQPLDLGIGPNSKIAVVTSFGDAVTIGSDPYSVDPSASAALLFQLAPDSDVKWTRSFHGTSMPKHKEPVVAVSVTDGSIYVAEGFESDAAVGLDLPMQPALGSSNAFIAKYASDGMPVWVTTLASNVTGLDITDIAVGSGGHLAVVGHSDGDLSSAAGTLTDPGTFVVALNGANGEVDWQRYLGEMTYATTVVLADGDVVVGGGFTGTVVIDSISLESAGAADIYLARLKHTSGDVAWAKRYGGSDSEFVAQIAATGDGALALTGLAGNPTTLNFGGGELLGNVNSRGPFLAKLRAQDAEHIWSYGYVAVNALIPGRNQVHQTIVTADSCGSVTAAFTLAGIHNFGGGELDAEFGGDFAVGLFLVKLDPGGEPKVKSPAAQAVSDRDNRPPRPG